MGEKLKILFDKEKITRIWSVRPEDYYRPLGYSHKCGHRCGPHWFFSVFFI